VADDSHTAFGRALANLDPMRWDEFRAGRQRFVRAWPQHGPWVDAASCSECHYRDGRGPAPADSSRSHLLRLGQLSGGSDPIYGIQLRRTGHGVPAPGQFAVQWERIVGRYLSGEPYVLRRPRVRVSDLAYGPLDSRTRLALRVPLAVFGLGLLEGVPDLEILTSADPDDADKDGVSGRAQRVRHPATGSMVVGRFGWKASQPSLAAQSAAALENDLGVANAGESELSALVGYLRALAVPASRRSTEPVVRAGDALFAEIGCADCHRPRLTTGVVAGWPELTHQTIAAYTDLLLHDMGAGLADEIGEGVASGREWRTPPLWGLGLLHTVGGPVGLLHDGRAASVEEAILWHDGEAARTRERFLAMPRTKREALIVFLSSL
jgi:CxxC motif-containing protein (DUF1111 family)